MNSLDRSIFEAFRKGEKHAIEAVYTFYKAPVMRFIVSMVKDANDSESIFHEVIMKIIRRREKLCTDEGINAYVFTIAKNEVIDYFKKLKKDRERIEDYYKNRIQTSETMTAAEEEEIFANLEYALEGLSVQRKKVIELSYFQNLSYQEIADKLMISKNTVKNHLIKAKLMLREQLL
ncbi:sigma-70 family RNA polymerase sigma factor [Algoriphagus sp. H41]|uniref:Sigma-70 family RNA polymerase sigma factor n=1 Tax=Algoriphagus oliviformis TaxID=2811231 RepID=A0ABS3C987_9BACT|nr:sigma-70 family RNA polymerase sigma factor [Algoriphagus oliviformis]MBN7813672.1 sigma-70 family RNA polymerase sigma factor [Algoriphagus oliviformis]